MTQQTQTPTRKIVHIDEDKCDGCGLCVPSCAEGAIQIIDGKARLLAENLCDGLGACLGECPKDAIRIEERPAEAFDEQAVHEHLKSQAPQPPAPAPADDNHAVRPEEAPAPRPFAGCPGKAMRQFSPPPAETGTTVSAASTASRLGHWPVQLKLLPESGELWDGADVLLAADCAPAAMGDFHQRLLAGKTLALACPKLDDAEFYVEKLAGVLAGNDLASLTVVRMEVPCCGGLVKIVRQAMQRAGVNVPLTVVNVSVEGGVKDINGVPVG